MKIKNIVFSALMIGAISFNSAAMAGVGGGMAIDLTPLAVGLVGVGAGLVLGAQKGYALGAKTSLGTLGSVAGAAIGGVVGAVSTGIAGMLVVYWGTEAAIELRQMKENYARKKHRTQTQSKS